MVFGTLPGHGRAAEACIAHGHLARGTRECKNFVKTLRRAFKPFAAEVSTVEDLSACGVEELDTTGRLFVTLDRRHLGRDDDAEATARWQDASRIAAIVDGAAVAARVSAEHARRVWLWAYFGSLASKDCGDPAQTDSAASLSRPDLGSGSGGSGQAAAQAQEDDNYANANASDTSALLHALTSFAAAPDTINDSTAWRRAVDASGVGAGRKALQDAGAWSTQHTQYVRREARRVMQAALKPKSVSVEVTLGHLRAQAVRAAIAAGLAVHPPGDVARAQVRVVRPPVYVVATTCRPHQRDHALEYLQAVCARARETLVAASSDVSEPVAAAPDERRQPAAEPAAEPALAIDQEQRRLLQPTINVGLVGHVAHGKSSVCRYLSGKRTQQHSHERQQHGATIKLGYANCRVLKCSGTCRAPECFVCGPGEHGQSKPVPCGGCGGDTYCVRHVSFVDCPGHHDLITTMLTGASAFDAALLVVAANEAVPAPQTASHLSILTELGFKANQVLVLENKSELLFGARPGDGADEGAAVAEGRSALGDHGAAVDRFVHGSAADGSLAVPVSAHLGHNMDVVAAWLAQLPERNSESADVATSPRETEASLFNVVRSFDSNKPGDAGDGLRGGVLGGCLMHGLLSPGDFVELRPGRVVPSRPKSGKAKGGGKNPKASSSEPWRCEPIWTRVEHVMSGTTSLPSARPGGLIGVQVDLDPALTRADALTGMVAGTPGTLPPVFYNVRLDLKWLTARQLGHAPVDGSESEESSDSEDETAKQRLRVGEVLRVSIGSACTTAKVTRYSQSKRKAALALDRAVACEIGARVAVERMADAEASLVNKPTKNKCGGGGGGGGRSNASTGSQTPAAGSKVGWSLTCFGVVRDGDLCLIQGEALQAAALRKRAVPTSSPAALTSGDDPLGDLDAAALRDRFVALIQEKSSALMQRARVRVPPPELLRDGGARVVWANFGQTCASIRRPPTHLADYFSEGGLGTVSLAGDLRVLNAGTCEDADALSRSQLRIHTRAKALKDKVGRLLRNYCAEFVACRQCRSAHTTLTRFDDKEIRNRRATTIMDVACQDCGARHHTRRLKPHAT